jgi:hypothetical protein
MNGIRYGFTLWKKEGVRYLTIPSFEKAGGVRCAFSTRIGGVSPPPFDTLNFSRKREKSAENFAENMRRFSAAVGFDYQKAVSIRYAHGPNVYRAESRDAGCGVVRESVPQVCDGLCTDTEALPLLSFHADCVPLFFYDPTRRAAAVCHAGWRGVSQHIARNAVESLGALGCRAEHIVAAVGPCISVKHYEVGSEVADVFLREFGEETVQQRGSRYYAGLAEACAQDMLVSGLKPQQITVSGLCTYEQADLFFSHRRDEGRTGAMASIIELI